MIKEIILYRTAIYAQQLANTLPKGNSERIRLSKLIERFNCGKHVVFDNQIDSYSILNEELRESDDRSERNGA